MLHLSCVYIQCVILYEKLDFYDCGFAVFSSAAIKLRLTAYSAAAVAWVV